MTVCVPYLFSGQILTQTTYKFYVNNMSTEPNHLRANQQIQYKFCTCSIL